MTLPNIVARAGMAAAVIALAASGFQMPIAIAAPVRSGFVELSDATIFYRHAGQGPPVIFIHALLLDSRLWLDQLNVLCARRYCLAPDLSGFGFSSPMHGGRVDFSQYADEVIEFLDAMKICIGRFWHRLLLTGLSETATTISLVGINQHGLRRWHPGSGDGEIPGGKRPKSRD